MFPGTDPGVQQGHSLQQPSSSSGSCFVVALSAVCGAAADFEAYVPAGFSPKLLAGRKHDPSPSRHFSDMHFWPLLFLKPACIYAHAT
jgi:hypothetical protein